MKMYVGNLSFESTENDLQDLFEPHGTVNEVHLMMDRFTGKSRGFAFVTMNDGAQANAAMSALNGHELNGRPLTVNEARPREERPRPYGNHVSRCACERSPGSRAHLREDAQEIHSPYNWRSSKNGDVALRHR